MSANIEYALITRVVQDGDFHTLEKMQVTGDFFYVPELREVYNYLKETFHNALTPGQVPTAEMVKHRFPSFQVSGYVPDTVPVLAQTLRHEKLRMDVFALADKLRMEAEKDPFAALGTLKQRTQDLSAMADVGQDLTVAGGFQQLYEHYMTVAAAQGCTGIPYPWEVMNQETQGKGDGQFIIFYGRPKSMKTWIAIYNAVHDYKVARRRVLFYSKEMPPFQILQRVACALAGVSYKAFRAGTLQPELAQYVWMIMKDLQEDEASAAKHGHQPCFIITSDRGSAGGGISWLQAKIREVRPDIVYVDGIYLMKDDRSNKRDADWKVLTNVTRDIKQTALEFNIPIVGITQANRNAERTSGQDLTELAYSDSLGMDADAIFRVKRVVVQDESTQGVKKTFIYITAPGMREGVFDGIVINGEPCTDFTYVRTLIDADEANEAADDYGKKKGPDKPGGATFKRDNPQNFRDPKMPHVKV